MLSFLYSISPFPNLKLKYHFGPCGKFLFGVVKGIPHPGHFSDGNAWDFMASQWRIQGALGTPIPVKTSQKKDGCSTAPQVLQVISLPPGQISGSATASTTPSLPNLNLKYGSNRNLLFGMVRV